MVGGGTKRGRKDEQDENEDEDPVKKPRSESSHNDDSTKVIFKHNLGGESGRVLGLFLTTQPNSNSKRPIFSKAWQRPTPRCIMCAIPAD